MSGWNRAPVAVISAVQGVVEIYIDGAPASEFGSVRARRLKISGAQERGAALENGPAVEAVSEYTVLANAFNAEYGGFGSWFTTVT